MRHYDTRILVAVRGVLSFCDDEASWSQKKEEGRSEEELTSDLYFQFFIGLRELFSP